MNKILAVFRKEYKETRITTLVFLLVGLLFPLIKLLVTQRNYGVFNSFLNADPFLFGGLIAVWLNAATLCAISFAREREKGTFQTLRRIANDWRVAVAGKFGYVLASSLALAAFFCVESAVAAIFCCQRPFAAFCEYVEGHSYQSDGTLALAFGITTVCWAVFWTSRVARQITAIFLTFLCPLLITAIPGIIFIGIEFGDMSSNMGLLDHFVVEGIVGAFGLLALVAAPYPKRFGYRATEKQTATPPSENGPDDSWDQVDVQKKGRAFPTLVSLAFTDAAILFKSPVSILFELAILSMACALVFAVNLFSAAREISEIAFLFYYLCFASGLFFDSKRKSSIVQERLKVKPSEYWFANAVAAFVVMAAVSVAFGFFTPSHRGIQFAPTPNEAQTRTFVLGVQTTENLLLLFGVSLWCAAFKTSRLVAGTVTLVVFYFVFFCWIDGHYKASVILGYENAKGATLLASMLVVLVFAFASFKIVTGRTHSRKTPWSVAIPIVLTLSFVTLRMGPEPAHLPPKFHSWELDVNSFPKKQKEYDKLVDEAKSAVEKVETSPLFITSNGTDKVAVELNDLRKRFIDACALTKMRAAGLTDVENAEKAFYEALNKAIQNRSGREPEELELNGLKKFLNEIPSIRPTAEQQAENAYVFAQFGKLDSGVKSSDARDIIAKARVKNNRVWKRAFWNSIQTIPSDLTDQIKRASKVTIDDANSIRLFNETSKMFEDKPGYANNPDPKSAIRRQREYAEIFWAISPSEQSGFNELERRTLLSNLRQSP